MALTSSRVYELYDGSTTFETELLTGSGKSSQFLGEDFAESGYVAFGDALTMSSRARGGADLMQSGNFVGNAGFTDGPAFSEALIEGPIFFPVESSAVLIGDANQLQDRAAGGNDRILGGINSTGFFVGDGYSMDGATRGGADVITGNTAGDIGPDGYAFGASAFTMMIGDGALMGGRAAGGADRMTGGDAYAYAGSTTTSNLMVGDGYSMQDASRGATDQMVGGSAYVIDGSVQVSNFAVGDGYALGGAAVGATDNLRGGDVHLFGNGDGYAINLLSGDAFVMFDAARGGADVLQGGSVVVDTMGDDAEPADVDGYGVVFNIMAGDTFDGDGALVFGNDKLTGGSGTAGADGYAVNLMFGDVGSTDFLGPILGGPVIGNRELPDSSLARSLSDLETRDSTMPTTKFGNDVLVGGSTFSMNLMVGDAEELYEGQTGGNDKLVAGGIGSVNVLVGDAMAIYDGAHGGNDTLVGGAGNDQMAGDAMDLFGGGGNDLLVSISLDMGGFGGADRFIVAGGGQDMIMDFHAFEGDRIDFAGMRAVSTDFGGWKALVASGRVEQTDQGVLIHMGADAESTDSTLLIVGAWVEDIGAGLLF